MELLNKKITKIHNYIYANEGLSNIETLTEFLKIFYCKILDENSENKLINFNNTEIYTFLNLFEKLKNKLNNIFEANEKINLKEETIFFILNELKDINFSTINYDTKGHILQKIIDRSYRESRGQFFTPPPVVDFIVKMINPQKNELGCDPASGTGGFMFSAMEKILKKEKFNKNTHKNFYFYDISKTLVKLISMRMMFEFSEENANCYIKDSISEEFDIQFDYVISNPPFGSQGKILNPKVLGKYQLGMDDSGKTLKSQIPDILFVEKIIKILKENGRAAVILPDGNFENPTLQYFRKFLVENVKIDAIISLPDGTFIPYGTGVKSSIVFFTKLSNKNLNEALKKDYNVFYGKIEKLGYTFSKHSKETYLKNGLLDEDYSEILDSYKNKKFSDKAFLIPINKIKSNNYILSESFYSPVYNKIIDEIKKNRHAKLKDLVDFKYTKEKIKKDKIYNYVEIADINSYTSEIINYSEMFGEDLPSRASYILKENDLIVATSGNSIGTSKQSKALVTKEYQDCICTNGFTVMTARKISPYYLLKFFNSKAFLGQILKYKYGTAIPCISREHFENILIEIPEKSKMESIEQNIKKALKLREEAMALMQN